MVHATSCVCGFVVRDGGDVIAFDMCNGEMGETKPHLSVKNRDLTKSGIRITESYQGRKVTVSTSQTLNIMNVKQPVQNYRALPAVCLLRFIHLFTKSHQKCDKLIQNLAGSFVVEKSHALCLHLIVLNLYLFADHLLVRSVCSCRRLRLGDESHAESSQFRPGPH